MKFIYAGIGSRAIDSLSTEMKFLIINVAKYLAENNFILRSGSANGCDTLFEQGCDQVSGKKEIYLPWKNFNGSKSQYYTISEQALKIAEKHHPAWNRLSNVTKKLQARNSYQLLGFNLDEPVDFVICFTNKGLTIGGTGQAIRLAEANNIPVFNLGEYSDYETCRVKLWEFLQNIK